MALTGRRDADVLARLVDGEDVPGAPVPLRELAQLAGAIPRPAVAPDPAFVARLREGLVDRAEARARERVAPPVSTSRRATPPPRRELVLRVPRGLLPGAVAGVLGLAVLVAGLSSRALPGDRLYDVKLGIGQAQVRLAGDDLARGRALLAQVDHRLDEVDALVAAGDPRSTQVDVALDHAADDLAGAQRLLLAGDAAHTDPDALLALADASAQAQGRLRALAPLLPTASGPDLRHLLALLQVGDAVVRQQALACGDACADLRRRLSTTLPGGDRTAPAADGGTGAGAQPTDRAGAGGSASASRPVVVVPPTAVTRAPGAGAPGPTSVPQQPSAPGVTVSVPGVGITVPGPALTTAPGGQPTLTVPPVGATVGPLTASVSTSGCVVALGPLCVGG